MSVTLTIDRMHLLRQAMSVLDNGSVLIGIPDDSEKNHRNDTPETNSEIAFTNEFGEPAENIPARPFLIPGVNNAMEKNERIMLKGAQEVLTLTGNPLDSVHNALEAVGLVSARSAQKMIDDGLSPDPAPYTLMQRRLKGFMGEKPLLVTGNLKQSITYIIEDD